MNDQTEQLPADPPVAPAPPTAVPLDEPTEWLEWDEPDGPEAPVPLAGAAAGIAAAAPKTLAELRPEGSAEHGVSALRAILLGGEPRDYGARLAAIERRLDEREARLRALEQRLERLAESIEQARDAARAADVTLDSLHALQRHLDEVRRDQAHLQASVAERARDADERCRLRQRQVRTASRLELRRLRGRLYARDRDAESWTGEGHTPPRAAALRSAAPQLSRPAHPLAEDPHAGLPGWDLRDGQWTPALSVASSVASPEDAPDAVEAGDGDGHGDGVDASTAWRAVRRSTVALLRALLAWVVALAQLAADDMRAAVQRIGDLFRR